MLVKGKLTPRTKWFTVLTYYRRVEQQLNHDVTGRIVAVLRRFIPFLFPEKAYSLMSLVTAKQVRDVL